MAVTGNDKGLEHLNVKSVAVPGMSRAAPAKLVAHLQSWLGAWPPPPGEVQVIGSDRREAATGGKWWLPALAISAPHGTVLSLPPRAVDAVRQLPPDVDSPGFWEAVAALIPGTDPVPGRAVFRWTERPAEFSEVGGWIDPGDPRVPNWLRGFDGDVLVAFDERHGYVAGAGRKQHDLHGHEISVGTEPVAQGHGLARGLVAHLARRILADGAIPTYIHEATNVPSCRVAEAVGFADRGWRVTALWGGKRRDE